MGKISKAARKAERQRRSKIMRSVTFTADQFDNFIFPVWANAQRPGDPEVVLRVTRRLKAISEEVPLTPPQQAAVDAGRRIYNDRKMVGESREVIFETDELNVLRDAYKAALPNFNPFAMEDAYAVFEAMRDAKEWVPEADRNVAPAEPEFSSE